VAGTIGGPVAVESILARRKRRIAQLGDPQLREAVDALAAGLRAGLSLRRALAEAVRDAEPPLRPSLEGAVRRLEAGEPLDQAIGELAAVDARDARLLTSLLAVHRRTGGDLPVVLDQVASIIGQRIEARRRVAAFTAQGRASGAVLAVLPVAFITLLSWTSGDGLGAFYRTPLGAALLVAGLVCDALGFMWIRRIVRVPA
jgi:tight adherence protein B